LGKRERIEERRKTMERSKNVVKIELKDGHASISSKAPTVSSEVAVLVVMVDLQMDALNALKERYGPNVPEIN
jgi:hypothetical protein